MVMRRRPLLRAAAVGGGAYIAGKRAAQRSAEREQVEAGQDARISDLEQQQAYTQQAQPAPQAPPPPPAAQAGAAGASLSDQLKQLSALHDSGSLSDSEFTAAKQRLLGI